MRIGSVRISTLEPTWFTVSGVLGWLVTSVNCGLSCGQRLLAEHWWDRNHTRANNWYQVQWYWATFSAEFHCHVSHILIVVCEGTGVGGLTRSLPTLPKVPNQCLNGQKCWLEDPGWAWGEQVHGMWYFIRSVPWHCWLSDTKGIRQSVKCWVLVWWWWRFDWSFAMSYLSEISGDVGRKPRFYYPCI